MGSTGLRLSVSRLLELEGVTMCHLGVTWVSPGCHLVSPCVTWVSPGCHLGVTMCHHVSPGCHLGVTRVSPWCNLGDPNAGHVYLAVSRTEGLLCSLLRVDIVELFWNTLLVILCIMTLNIIKGY